MNIYRFFSPIPRWLKGLLLLVIIAVLGASMSAVLVFPSPQKLASQEAPAIPTSSVHLPLLSNLDQNTQTSVSFKHPLTAPELTSFFAETNVQPDYLFFIEEFEGEYITGGYRVSNNQDIEEALEILRENRIRATKSYIEVLEHMEGTHLTSAMQHNQTQTEIQRQFTSLQARQAMSEIRPLIFAVNVTASVEEIERVKTHPSVNGIRPRTSQTTNSLDIPLPVF